MDGVSGLFLGFFYAVGSIVCHQLPDRSFHLYGIQLPVCARCTGLYLGGAVGLAAWLGVWSPRVVAPDSAVRALVVTGLPTAVTVLTASAGVWDPSNPARALAALPLGLAGGALVGAVLAKDLR